MAGLWRHQRCGFLAQSRTHRASRIRPTAGGPQQAAHLRHRQPASGSARHGAGRFAAPHHLHRPARGHGPDLGGHLPKRRGGPRVRRSRGDGLRRPRGHAADREEWRTAHEQRRSDLGSGDLGTGGSLVRLLRHRGRASIGHPTRGRCVQLSAQLVAQSRLRGVRGQSVRP